MLLWWKEKFFFLQHASILSLQEMDKWTFCFVSRHKYRSASATPSNSPQSSQQSVYQPAQQGGSVSAPQDPASASSLTSPPEQPSWNPFGDDNFSKLTAEDLLNKDFTKLADGNFINAPYILCTRPNFNNSILWFWSGVWKCFLFLSEPAEPLIITESLIPGLEAAEPIPPSAGRCSFLHLEVVYIHFLYRSLWLCCVPVRR